MTVHHEIYLKIPALKLAILIPLEALHRSHIYSMPSAEMSFFKYALRSKYIVYDVFLCQDTIFGRKYTLFTR